MQQAYSPWTIARMMVLLVSITYHHFAASLGPHLHEQRGLASDRQSAKESVPRSSQLGSAYPMPRCESQPHVVLLGRPYNLLVMLGELLRHVWPRGLFAFFTTGPCLH